MSAPHRPLLTAFLALPLLAPAGCSPATPTGVKTVMGPPTAEAKPEPDAGPGFFVERTAESGIDFRYRSGQEAGHLSILETLGGGVALLDYDGDGLLDIFVTGGGYFDGPGKRQIQGYPSRLYRNLGNWKFREVTAEVGLDGPLFYTHGCAVADYDNDGWPDLLVTGWGRVALYHNVPDGRGGRRFEDVTERAGLKDFTWATSAAWGDFNGDGWPDLYVCQYVNWSWDNNPPCTADRDRVYPDRCPPQKFKALPHRVYLNNGNGTFREAGREMGLVQGGKGLGVLVTDLDGDGRPDVYVANDTTDNFLYHNRGGTFAEVGIDWGAAQDDFGKPNGSMGIDAADYDGSGHLSLFVTNYQNEAHALYRNLGSGRFLFASHAAGITAIGLDFVGWGTGFLDFDRDGNEDLFLTHGHTQFHPLPPSETRQRPVLFRNTRKPGDEPRQVRFEDVSARAGAYFQRKGMGRGVAFGDLDNDGRTDIVISQYNEPVVLLQNALDNGHHWLGVELVGKPNRDAVGARLTLEVGGRKLVRAVKGGGSYLSANDRRVLFGLGAETRVGKLSVRWPWGQTETWDGLAVDRYWKLTRGEPAASPDGGR